MDHFNKALEYGWTGYKFLILGCGVATSIVTAYRELNAAETVYHSDPNAMAALNGTISTAGGLVFGFTYGCLKGCYIPVTMANAAYRRYFYTGQQPQVMYSDDDQ